MRLVAVETRRVGRLAGAGARGQRRARGRGHGTWTLPLVSLLSIWLSLQNIAQLSSRSGLAVIR